MTRGQRMPRMWRLMWRDTDPRSHEAARCLGTYRTKIAAEQAQRFAFPPAGVQREHFHVWVEKRV